VGLDEYQDGGLAKGHQSQYKLDVSSHTVMTMGGLGRLAALHLPGGPVGPPSEWAAKSNGEAGQTVYPVNKE